MAAVVAGAVAAPPLVEDKAPSVAAVAAVVAVAFASPDIPPAGIEP